MVVERELPGTKAADFAPLLKAEVARAWDALSIGEVPPGDLPADSGEEVVLAADLEESRAAFFEAMRNDLRTDLAEEALDRFLEQAQGRLDAGGASGEEARAIADAFRQFFFLLGLDSYYGQAS